MKIKLSKYDLKKIVIIGAIALFLIGGLTYKTFKSEDLKSAINGVEIVENEVNEVSLKMLPTTTLNPLISNDEDYYYISKLIYSSLFTFDEDMTPVNDLAESYTFGENSISINLKSAKWHDGENVTAEDIIYTVKSIKNIGENGPYYRFASKIKSVSGSGNNVEIVFKEKSDISLAYLSFPIVPEHLYKTKDIEDFYPIGSGMYKVAEYDKTKELLLEPNNEYYGDKAKSKVDVNILKSSANFTNMVETSNLSILLDTSMEKETKITKKDIKIKEFTSNQFDYIGFNFESEFFKDKKLRKAFAYAIDIEKIIEEHYYNNVLQSMNLYMPNYLGVKSEKDKYNVDIDKANEILKEAGYIDNDSNGILESKSDKSVEISLLVRNDITTRVETAEDIKSSLDNIGIKVNIVSVDEATYRSYLQTGNFDCYIGGMEIDESSDLRPILHKDGEFNYIKYNNKKLNGYLDDFMSGNAVEATRDTLIEIQKIINDDLPYYCIGYYTYGLAKAPVLQGDLTPTFYNPYDGIETWNCIYEKRIEKNKDKE